MMHLLWKFTIAILAGSVLTAHADQWSDSEIRAMPPYCAARLHKDAAQAAYWRSVLGPDYLHTHHFCAGIGYINRYYGARTERSKAFNLQNALGNLNYMITHASPDYSLMPEVYLNRGRVHVLMKKDGTALTDILKAIELDPKLPKAYSMLAEVYLRLGKKDEALGKVTEGLRHNPQSSVLQRLYVELGGALPYPEPFDQTEPTTPAAADDATSVEPASPAAATPETRGAFDTVRPDSGQQTPAAAPQIGSPSNPWCRFCPPEPER